jgi:hypothetical protein
VLWLCIRWTLAPREDAPDHVKRSILGDDGPESRGGLLVVEVFAPAGAGAGGAPASRDARGRAVSKTIEAPRGAGASRGPRPS